MVSALYFRDPSTGNWTEFKGGFTDHGSFPDNATGDPHPDLMTQAEMDPTFVYQTGDTVLSGDLRIPNVYLGSLSEIYASSSFPSLVPRRIGSGSYVELEVASPTNDAHAVTNGWLTGGAMGVRLSGPHQGNSTSHPYYTLPNQAWAAMPNGYVRIAPNGLAGRYRLSVMTTVAITGGTDTHNTVYIGMQARWYNPSNGVSTGALYRNSCAIAETRFTAYAASSNRGYFRGWCEGWIDNVPGHALTWGLTAYKASVNCTAQIGNFYRISAEFYPEATVEAGLASGWVNYA